MGHLTGHEPVGAPGRPASTTACVETVGEVLGVVAACVLALIGCLHVAWAFGVRWGQGAVIPTVDGRPTLSPGRGITIIVGVLLLAAGDLYMGAADGRSPAWFFRLGACGVALVLLARVVGDRRTVGLTKQVKDTPFARKDTTVYVPLCLALAVCGLFAAFT